MKKLLLVMIAFSLVLIQSCTKADDKTEETNAPSTSAEKLGFPAGKKVIILHADDSGMCPEANEAVKNLLQNGYIQSTSMMAPCPAFEDIAQWYKKHPEMDMGMHLSLTSEWKTYRWGPVADPKSVPGLVDPDGKFWHEVPGVVQHAAPEEVKTEIRAQIEKALALGIKPSHIDTHMGTLYGTPEFAKVYFEVAMEYKIPAMVLEMTPAVVQHFREQGYPITDDLIADADSYTMPKLDYFFSAPEGKTYQEKKENFYKLVKSIPPGLTEIIFHPSVESDNLKSITNSWQQRVWEYQMFSDPEMIEFFNNQGIVFTNWKEVMERFRGRK
jgi:predicted glycoside hydrolase/deacetylase ChbG (UPF0249 family)